MRGSRHGRAQRLVAALAFVMLCLTVGVATYPTRIRGEALATARVVRNLGSGAIGQRRYVALVSFSDRTGRTWRAKLPPRKIVAYAPGESLRVAYREDQPMICRARPLLASVAWPAAAAVAAVFGFWRLARRPRAA